MRVLIALAFIVALIPLFSVLLTTIVNGVLNSRAWIWRASICRTFDGPSGPPRQKGLSG